MPILLYPDPHLRYECHLMNRFDRWLAGVCDAMFREMGNSKGIGLAAPQVGLPFSLFVMKIPEPQVYINPTVQYYGTTTTENEACLSIPGLIAPVARFNKIRISASDQQGIPFQKLLSGLAARCAQHEYDHLQGVLFTDRCQKGLEQAEFLAQLAEKQAVQGDRVVLSEKDTERLNDLRRQYCYGDA